MLRLIKNSTDPKVGGPPPISTLSYQGVFKRKIVYKDGGVYEGPLNMKSQRNGKGTYKTRYGVRYEGEWTDDKQT